MVLIAGAGSTTIDGITGAGTELAITGSGDSFISLDAAADSVVGGSGASTLLGGASADIYGFIDGHAGGSEIIFGLKADDALLFGNYGNHPIVTETVVHGADRIILADGTTITLQGIDHKVFNGLE
jgi:serralysin